MNGAYLLWDSLLQELSKQQSKFLPLLLKSMHAAMNQPSPWYQISQDPGKEALHHWLLHIATSDAWAQARQHGDIEVDSQLMPLCCLHPSHWSHALGEELLEAGTEDFTESWSDLLVASSIGGAVDMEAVGAAESTQDVDMAEFQTLQNSMPDEDTQSDIVVDMAGWREALKAPTVPIGVV